MILSKILCKLFKDSFNSSDENMYCIVTFILNTKPSSFMYGISEALSSRSKDFIIS